MSLESVIFQVQALVPVPFLNHGLYSFVIKNLCGHSGALSEENHFTNID